MSSTTPPPPIVGDTPSNQPDLPVSRQQTGQSDLAPLYRTLGIVLTWGFRLTAALLASGLILAAIQDDDLSEESESLPEIAESLLDGDSSALVDLAIVAMVLTPVVAVVVVAVGFLRLGDRRYALASLFVLAVLGVSIAVSLLT